MPFEDEDEDEDEFLAFVDSSIFTGSQDVCCAKLNLESENEYVEQRNRNTPKHIIGTLWVITPTRQRLAANRKRTLRRHS